MARRARALRVTLRSLVVALMAVKATAHTRQLIAGCLLELLDGAVALAAPDVPRQVLLVSTHHFRARHLELRNAVAVLRLVADMAEAALAEVVVSRRDFAQVRVVGRMARVAHNALRNQRVVDRAAVERGRVTRLARRSLLEVKLVIEAEGQLLRREDDLAPAFV